MSNDYRALCAELVDQLHQHTQLYEGYECELVSRARAALAQPEPEGMPPRVGHILRLAEIIREVDGNHCKGAAALAEAILSNPGSRWSPTIEPEGVGDEAWQEFIEQVKHAQHVATREGEGPRFDLVECALALWREAIARSATPQPSPVPVAERLPELRGMFERILSVDRYNGRSVSHIQLADRLIDAVVSWAGDALPVPGAEVG